MKEKRCERERERAEHRREMRKSVQKIEGMNMVTLIV